MNKIELAVGQVWKSADKRFGQFVRVVSVSKDGGAVSATTCDESGVAMSNKVATEKSHAFGGKGTKYAYFGDAVQ